MVPSRKNSISGLNIKKEFIERQLAVTQYVEEAERLALGDMLRDPIVVHSLEDYAEAYQEHEKLRAIKSTMRNLCKMKRKNIDLAPFLNSLAPCAQRSPLQPEERSIEAVPPPTNTRQLIFEPLSIEEPLSYTKERGVEDFKVHLQWINSLPRFSIQQPVFARNMPSSTSHSQLIKRLEKQDVSVVKEASPTLVRPVNEITTTTTFKNGVMRSVPSVPSAGQRTAPDIPRGPGIPLHKGSPNPITESFSMLKRPAFTMITRPEESAEVKRQRTKSFDNSQSEGGSTQPEN